MEASDELKKLKSSPYRLHLFLRALQCKDRSPLRRAIYQRLLATKRIFRLLDRLYAWTPARLKFIALGLFCLQVLGKVTRQDALVENTYLWQYVNENRALCETFQLPHRQYPVHFDFLTFCRNLLCLRPRSVLRFLRVCRAFARKHDLLIAARSAELIAYAHLFRRFPIFSRNVYFSCDAAPFALGALNSFAGDVTSFYTPHGIMPACDNKLFYDVCIFREKYSFSNMRARCLGTYRLHMNEAIPAFPKLGSRKLKVGIACSVIPNSEQIRFLCAEIREDGHDVLVKLHPNALTQPGEFTGLPIANDLKDCNLIICGNSGFAYEMLSRSKPVLFLSRLDFAPPDVLGLSKRGLLPKYEKVDGLATDEFYSDPRWIDRWNTI